MGGLMRLLGLGSSGSSFGRLMAAILTMVLASGCASTDAYRYGSGAFALNGAECNQTDSTVTCCLKQNPGQYERCGATPPAQSEPINVGPPGLGSLEAAEQGESKDEKRKRCLPDYVACIDKIGLKPGSLSGTSQCQDCYNYCERHGFWPLSMNQKPCPGAD
jgi:hypothetical protein